MALNDMRGLVASTPALTNASPVRLRSDDAVPEVTRRPDVGPDFAQVMAERHAEQMASERGAEANAAARGDENSRTARAADRNNEARPVTRNSDSDSTNNVSAEEAAANAAAAVSAGGTTAGAPPASTAHGSSGAAGDRSRGRSGDDRDAAAAAGAASIGAKDLAGTIAVYAAINPAVAAALAAASAMGDAASAPPDTAGGTATRTVTDAPRGSPRTAALVGGSATDAVPVARGARDVAGDLAAAALDDRGGNAAPDAKHGNAKQDSRLDVAVDPQAIAADAPSAAAGARDRLLEDFEQRFARVHSAAAEGVARGDGQHAVSSAANAALIAATGATAGTTAGASPIVTTGIATPVTQPGFGEALGDRVVILVQQRVASAQITVTPPDLGPVTIGIEMHGQDASLSFTAAHPATRAAIEDALPRLRDMFANNGLNLAQANVGGETRRDPGRSQRGTQGSHGNDRLNNAIDAIGAAPAPGSRVTTFVGAPRLIDIRV